MTGLWIKPCQFQTVVMDVLEQQPGCSGGWIQRSALHALQVSFEHVVKSTLGEARKSAANRKSAVVAGADVAAGAPDTGMQHCCVRTTALHQARWPRHMQRRKLHQQGKGAPPLHITRCKQAAYSNVHLGRMHRCSKLPSTLYVLQRPTLI